MSLPRSRSRLPNRRKLYSLWSLSDVDYQCGWCIFLIEGFLDNFLYGATILRSQKIGKPSLGQRKRLRRYGILRTYRTPHDSIVTLRGIENYKLFLDVFPRLRFDLAFVERHGLVDEFTDRTLCARGGSGSRLSVNSSHPPRRTDYKENIGLMGN
jgi:hypothetical protein